MDGSEMHCKSYIVNEQFPSLALRYKMGRSTLPGIEQIKMPGETLQCEFVTCSYVHSEEGISREAK